MSGILQSLCCAALRCAVMGRGLMDVLGVAGL